MAATIDDVVSDQYGLEGLVEDVKDVARHTYRFMAHILKGSLVAAASGISYGIWGLAGPVTGGAMALGRIIVDYKNSVKTKLDDVYKEWIKGLVLGGLAKSYYKYVISAIPNATIYGKVGRTLAYNPGFLGGVYNPAYLGLTRTLEGKVGEKGEWWKLTKKVFPLSVFHYGTTNHLVDPTTQAIASAGLGTAYRVIAG